MPPLPGLSLAGTFFQLDRTLNGNYRIVYSQRENQIVILQIFNAARLFQMRNP